jgi:hypothetical protein
MGGEVLVLGIVGLLTWLIPFFGLPIPLLGLVWGIVLLRRKPPKKLMLYSGVVMCSLGLFLSAGYSVVNVMINTTSTTPTSTDLPGGGGTTSPPVNTGPVEWTADGEIQVGEYDNSKKFGNSYEIFWNSDGEFIYIGIQVATNGWVGVGLQPDIRSNTNVDMILGFVDGAGRVSIYDLFNAEYPGLNPQDVVIGGSDDILLAAGTEGMEVEVSEDEEGPVYTTIEFARMLNTGDQYDQIFYDGPNTIIWAYGREDSRDTDPFEQGYGVLEVD